MPLTSLLGRELEVAAARSVLRRDQTRLLTLTGPGGVGKTRLAIEVAATVAIEFRDGVTFVPLAAVDDLALVLPSIVIALGLRPGQVGVIGSQLRGYFGGRDALLVLDNLEQIAAVGPLLAGLLSDCQQLTILATSRALLRISGEHAFPVLPLSVPPDAPTPLEQLERFAAVRLFVERARAGMPEFTLTDASAPAVAEVCRRLDGLPLALELAAAWTRLFPPDVLLARMDQRLPLLTGGPVDQPYRLQTMRGAIAWSYDLLPRAEQALFRSLAVFVDGFSLAAVAAVADLAPGAIALQSVASLADQSLLQARSAPDSEPRFGMLETVREFGFERLIASGDDVAVQRRHAEYFLSLAEEAGPLMRGSAQRRLLDRLDAEYANIRAVLTWSVTNDEIEIGLRVATALVTFWLYRGYLAEGREWLDRLLNTPSPSVSAARRAWALNGVGYAAGYLGDYETAATRLREAIETHRLHADRPGEAHALAALGAVSEYQGDDAAATSSYAAALALFRDFGEHAWAANMLENLADAAYRGGDLDGAERLGTEALAASRAAHDAAGVAIALVGAAQVTAERGELGQAAVLVGESLTLALGSGLPAQLADSLAAVARLAGLSGRAQTAARLLGAASRVRNEAGRAIGLHHEQERRAVSAARAALSDVEYRTEWLEGDSRPLVETVAEARMILTAELVAGPAPAPSSGSWDVGYGLTPREQEVLRLLVAGRSNQMIADELFVGIGTVKTHVTAVLAKLGVASRTAAAALVFRQRLDDPGS